jgi:hypothetical protein
MYFLPESKVPGEQQHYFLWTKEAKPYYVWTRGGVYVENWLVGRKK